MRNLIFVFLIVLFAVSCNKIKIEEPTEPVFQVTDYIGKSGETSFPATVPFVTFNMEIRLISVESSYNELDLSYQYSPDKKTIVFPNIKIPALENVKISYVAMAPDSAIVKSSFEVKAYESAISSDPHNGQKIIFTKDNNYFWLLTRIASGASTLVQYSTKDLSVTNKITWKDGFYSDFFYNPYDNTILIVQNYYLDENDIRKGKIDLYNAANGRFINELDLRAALGNNLSIVKMAFGSNGYGLMMIEGSSFPRLFYINTANKYKCGLFSDDPIFYDPHHPDECLVRYIVTCNNGKTLALIDDNPVQNIFTVDTETKNIQRYSVKAHYFLSNYSNPEIFVGSEYYKSGSYIDVNTNSKNAMTINNAGSRAVFLNVDNSFSTILTSNLSVINLKLKEEKKLKCLSEVYPFVSSNDGKIVVAGYKNRLLLFNSETFVKYSDKIQ